MWNYTHHAYHQDHQMIMVQWNRSTSAYGNKIPVLPSFHHSKHFGQYHKKTFSVDLLSRFGLLYSVCKSFFKACYKILCRVSMKTGHGLQASCQCHSRVFIRGFHSFLMLFLTTAITYKDTGTCIILLLYIKKTYHAYIFQFVFHQ